MKKKVRSNVSILLALVIVMSQLISATAADADYIGHWAETEITAWVEAGIISGYPDGSFQPNKAVTRAEFVTMLDNLFGYQDVAKNKYTDVASNAWYADAVLKASAAGVVQGSDNFFRPLSEISRQEAAVALYNAFKMEAEENKEYRTFADSTSVATWAAEQINALVVGDYMSGRGDNELAPKASITRAEAVKFIDNIAGMFAGQSLEGTMVNGNLFITQADTVVSDAVITGNVYIAQSVGDGDVTFDDVKIEGSLVALGGGENTVRMNNTTVTKITVSKADGKIRLLVSGTTSVGTVKAESGVKLEEENLEGQGFQVVEVVVKNGQDEIVDGDGNVIARVDGNKITLVGDFEDVDVDAEDVEVKVESGTIIKMTVSENATGTKVDVAETVVVKELEVKATVEVTGTGAIEKAVVEAEGTSFEKEPEAIEIDEEITVVVGGEEKTAEDTTTPPPSTNTGGTGTTVTNVNLTFDLSSASNTHVLTITAPSNADYKVIADKVLTAVNNEFDVIYDKYNTNLENNEGMLLIDSITWFEYAGQDMLAGTIFEGQIRHLPATAGPNPDYTDLQKKDIAHDVLTVIENNINNIDTVEADVVSIANQVTFADVEYNGSTFTKATLSKNGSVVAEFVQGGDKAAFIGVFFDEVKAMTMGTNVEYTLTFELATGGTRTSVLSAQ